MSIQAINVIGNDTFNSLYSETKYVTYNKATVDTNTSTAFTTDNKNSSENNKNDSAKSDASVVSLSSDVTPKEQAPTGEKLDEKQKAVVEELKKRDQQVRQHEQSHVSAGQGLVISGPTYEYQTGPDGKQYAIGGEVRIDTSMPNDPEQAVQKARQMRSAALAPSDPSSQDLAIAQKAQRMEQVARQELAKVQSYTQIAEKGGGEVSHLTAYNEPSLALQSSTQRVQDNSTTLKTPSQRIIFSMINGNLKIDASHILDAIMPKSLTTVA